GGVVLARCALGNLRNERAPHEGAHRREAQQALLERCTMRSRGALHELSRGTAQLTFGHQTVDEARTQSLVGTQRLAGQHHLHGDADSGHLHQAHCTAESGMNAEQYFRQPEREPLVPYRDPVAAGEGELEASAERKAMHGRYGWKGKRGETIHYLLSAADELIAARLIGEAGEFLDVCARDESAFFCRDEHPAART